MKNSGLIVIGLGILVILLMFGLQKSSPIKLGSSIDGQSCTATTSAASWAAVPRVIATSTNGVPNIHTLCAVFIGTTHASIVEIKDATSSTDVSSTTIAILGASPANGSEMLFDVDIKRGLIVNTLTGFTGVYTFTYK